MSPNNQSQNQRVQSPDDARQQQGANDDEHLQEEGNKEDNQDTNKKFPPSNQDRIQTSAEQRETDATWEKPVDGDDDDIDAEDIEPEYDDDVSLPSSRGKEDDKKQRKENANPNNPANPNW